MGWLVQAELSDLFTIFNGFNAESLTAKSSPYYLLLVLIFKHLKQKAITSHFFHVQPDHYPQKPVCPGALPTIQLLLMLNPLIFLNSLIRLGSGSPWARGEGLAATQRGLLDRMYGNYSLISHLGHGNVCKLGFIFINSSLGFKWCCCCRRCALLSGCRVKTVRMGSCCSSCALIRCIYSKTHNPGGWRVHEY